jgi:hypothetical protein
MGTTELQLWIIVGLLAFFVVMHATLGLCHLAMHRRERTSKLGFGDLWDQNKIDELIVRSKVTLADSPNHQSALYFGAKALWSKGHVSEAKEYFEKLIQLEPSLRDTLQRELEIMNQGTPAK